MKMTMKVKAMAKNDSEKKPRGTLVPVETQPPDPKPPVGPALDAIQEEHDLATGASPGPGEEPTPAPGAETAPTTASLSNRSLSQLGKKRGPYNRPNAPRRPPMAKQPAPIDAALEQNADTFSRTVSMGLNALCVGFLEGKPMVEEESILVAASTKATIRQYGPDLVEKLPIWALAGSLAIVILPRVFDYYNRKKAAKKEAAPPPPVQASPVVIDGNGQIVDEGVRAT